MLKRIAMAAAMALAMSGCATQVNLSQTAVAKFTHADLQQASATANKANLTARVGVYSALDAQLTACENAISAAIPTVVPNAPIGIFTAAEVAAETVATGIPASVQENCLAITVPPGLLIPIK